CPCSQGPAPIRTIRTYLVHALASQLRSSDVAVVAVVALALAMAAARVVVLAVSVCCRGHPLTLSLQDRSIAVTYPAATSASWASRRDLLAALPGWRPFTP